MQRRNAALLVVGLAVSIILGDSPRYGGADTRSIAAVGQTTTRSAMPAGSAAQVLSIDPATGKIRTVPAQVSDLREILGDAISTSSEGLVEEKSPVKGGGVLINLQGRFQNAETAVLDPDGRLIAPCVTGSPRDAQPASGEVK